LRDDEKPIHTKYRQRESHAQRQQRHGIHAVGIGQLDQDRLEGKAEGRHHGEGNSGAMQRCPGRRPGITGGGRP
jgi:hypothetical protein